MLYLKQSDPLGPSEVSVLHGERYTGLASHLSRGYKTSKLIKDAHFFVFIMIYQSCNSCELSLFTPPYHQFHIIVKTAFEITHNHAKTLLLQCLKPIHVTVSEGTQRLSSGNTDI